VWSAIWILAGIIVKGTDERSALSRIRCLPVPGFIRLEHVVTMTQNFLASNYVLQRHSICISQHVIQHHEGGRSSQPSFAVKVCPGILWKSTHSQSKSVHLIIERSRVVRNSDTDITCASGLDYIALNAGT